MVDGMNTLAVIAKENGIAETDPLIEALRLRQDQLTSLLKESAAITVTDATQVTEMKAARVARLKLRELRIATENQRKKYKDDFLRKGRAIDALARWVTDQIEPTEKRLQECEDFAVIAEAKRKAELAAKRAAEVREMGFDPAIFANIGDIAEPAWQEHIAGMEAQVLAREAAAAKAETDRRAAEAARVAESKRLAEENARLKREREEVDAKHRQERAAADALARKEREEREAKQREADAAAAKERAAKEAALKKEREAREKVEAELKAKKDADAKAAAAAEKARKKAEAAPDAEKLIAYAAALRAVPMPDVGSEDARLYSDDIRARVIALADWIKTGAKSL